MRGSLYSSICCIIAKMGKRSCSIPAFPRFSEPTVPSSTGFSIGYDTGERRAAEIAAVRAQVAEENNKLLRKEIAERECAEKRLAHAALHDALTGLPNRALFIDRATASLAPKSPARGSRRRRAFCRLRQSKRW